MIQRLVLIAVATVASFAPASPTAAGARTPEATIAEGVVRGAWSGAVRTFFGIPFAEPPVGSRRWRPPERVAPWSGVRPAFAKGSPCVQLPQAGKPLAGSEDCLYLDVYAPVAKGRLPVFVYFYGGVMVTGSSRQVDAALLAERERVVVVVPNYRLGVFGFTTLPELDRESPRSVSGNYGFLDQQEALRWVRRNVAAFGGDPETVTIGGQSAGGYSVGMHLLSEESRPLFRRGIVMGMPFVDTTSILTMPGYVTNQWEQREGPSAYLPHLAGCGGAPDRLGCLRSRSTQEIAAAISNKPDMKWSPTIDGVVRRDLPPRMVVRGDYQPAPLLIGANQNEGGLNVLRLRTALGRPMTVSDYRSELLALEDGQRILEHFPPAAGVTPEEALAATRSESLNCRLVRNAAQFAQRAPVYVYLFADEDAPGMGHEVPGYRAGSYHAAEIQYVFGRGYPADRFSGAPPFSEVQRRLSARMMDYWGAFIREGRPASPTVWPEFSAAQSVLRLEPADEDRLATLATFRGQFHCDFWDSLQRER